MCYGQKCPRKFREFDRFQHRSKWSPFKTGKTCRGGIGCGLSECKQEKRFWSRHLGQLVCTEIIVNTN